MCDCLVINLFIFARFRSRTQDFKMASNNLYIYTLFDSLDQRDNDEYNES